MNASFINRTHMPLSELLRWISTEGQTYGLINTNAPIYADSARPDLIQELRNIGCYCPAKVVKDVNEGIYFCQGCTFILTKRSDSIRKEIRNYSWKRDKDGNWLDQPVKMYDHAMDALRYAVYTHWGKGRRQTAEPAASEGSIITDWSAYIV